MKYIFKYRKKFFWKKFIAIGHRYDTDQDKMIVFFEDGGFQEICEWKKCELKLGQDWVLSRKKIMEQEAGIDVKLNIGG
jgi:hypothetical protein